MPEKEKQLARTTSNPNLLEREEARLWRVALLFVVLLATALAAVTWERLQALPRDCGQRRRQQHHKEQRNSPQPGFLPFQKVGVRGRACELFFLFRHEPT